MILCVFLRFTAAVLYSSARFQINIKTYNLILLEKERTLAITPVPSFRASFRACHNHSELRHFLSAEGTNRAGLGRHALGKCDNENAGAKYKIVERVTSNLYIIRILSCQMYLVGGAYYLTNRSFSKIFISRCTMQYIYSFLDLQDVGTVH